MEIFSFEIPVEDAALLLAIGADGDCGDAAVAFGADAGDSAVGELNTCGVFVEVPRPNAQKFYIQLH